MTSAILPQLPVEIAYLALSTLLLLIHISVQAMLLRSSTSNRWSAGARDEPPVLSPLGGRAERALRNFLETFAAFAVLALALQQTGRDDWWSALGAALYFWGRVAYLPLYLAGVPWLRSAAWCVATLGIAVMLWRLAI